MLGRGACKLMLAVLLSFVVGWGEGLNVWTAYSVHLAEYWSHAQRKQEILQKYVWFYGLLMSLLLLQSVIYMFLDVYRNFVSDWQYKRGLIIRHSLLPDIICFKNIITYTSIQSTTVILHQQSTKHVTKWIILPTPLQCLHVSRLHICACSVYRLHFIMYSLLVGPGVA